MEVKVLSREIIAPSSPTPPHLKMFKLSVFDQLSPLIYTPLLYFYTNPGQTQEQLMAKLKKSLSKTLSHFFSLAGRIVDESICCGDEGAVFIVATVDCDMSEILKEPNNDVLSKLLPCYTSHSVKYKQAVEEYVQIVVQVNVFKCGGIALSFRFLHKLMDATTFSYFLRSWASINRGSSFDSFPSSNYETLSSLFPQTNLLPFHPRLEESFHKSEEQKINYCYQRFLFKSKAIQDLKDKIISQSSNNNVSNPTSVEVLSGFIWKHMLEQAVSVRTTAGSQQQPISVLTHAINLRKRMETELSEELSVGNLVWLITARYLVPNGNGGQVELSELVSLLRQLFEEVDQNYIQKLVGVEGTDAIVKLLGERIKLLSETPKLFLFSSWRNMGLNEVDLGWGKPVWIGVAGDYSTTGQDNIFVVLLDNVSGDGIEASILLDQEEMKLLLQNQEFLEFAVFNPTIPLPQPMDY